MLLEELRGRRLLIPTRRTLELLVHQAQSRAERVIYSALTNGLTDTQRKTLDSLLDQKPLPDRIEVASRKAARFGCLLPGGLTEESRYVVRCN